MDISQSLAIVASRLSCTSSVDSCLRCHCQSVCWNTLDSRDCQSALLNEPLLCKLVDTFVLITTCLHANMPIPMLMLSFRSAMLILKALGLLLSGLQHCIREQAQFEGSAMGLKSK